MTSNFPLRPFPNQALLACWPLAVCSLVWLKIASGGNFDINHSFLDGFTRAFHPLTPTFARFTRPTVQFTRVRLRIYTAHGSSGTTEWTIYTAHAAADTVQGWIDTDLSPARTDFCPIYTPSATARTDFSKPN